MPRPISFRRAALLLPLLFFSACSSEKSGTREEHVSRGDRFLAAGDVLQAIASYRMALYQDSLDAEVLGRLAKAYAVQGNADAADVYLRRATHLTYQTGLDALERGDTTAAVASFALTVELHPGHTLALNRLGDVSLARGDSNRALEYFARATRANPHHAEGFIKLGRLHAAGGRREQAVQAFLAAIAANINAADAYLELGRIYLDQQQWEAAAEQFDKVLRVDPRSMVARAELERARSHL